MAAEINIARLIRHLPEIRAALYEHRRLVLLPAAVVAGYFLLRDSFRDVMNRLSAYIYVTYSLEASSQLRAFREQMKSDLLKQRVRDPHPHNDETLRILEIGMGTGTNFKYFPKSSRVIGVESNPYYIYQLYDLQRSNENLARVIKGHPECLRGLSDESVDIVVSTLVLCSVRDLDKAIKEVKRVLVQGGRFYLFEHQACHISWNRYIAQILLNGIFRTVFDNCHLSRQISRTIEQNGFEMTNIQLQLGFRMYIMSSYVSGFVTKL